MDRYPAVDVGGGRTVAGDAVERAYQSVCVGEYLDERRLPITDHRLDHAGSRLMAVADLVVDPIDLHEQIAVERDQAITVVAQDNFKLIIKKL